MYIICRSNRKKWLLDCCIIKDDHNLAKPQDQNNGFYNSYYECKRKKNI